MSGKRMKAIRKALGYENKKHRALYFKEYDEMADDHGKKVPKGHTAVSDPERQEYRRIKRQVSRG